MLFGKEGIDYLQQLDLFPGLEHHRGAFLARNGLQFAAGVLLLDGVMQVALDGQVEPLLRTLLDLKAHTCRKPQQAQQTHRLIGETVDA